MKKLAYLFAGVTALASCNKEETPAPLESAEFTVTIENVSSMKENSISGVFNTPKGDTDPGPATPGKTYEFSFNAGKGQAISFATMFVQSNDLFYGTEAGGLALYDDNGNAITGDITSQITLWDAGTEVNMEPGVGMDQPPRQSGPNTGTSEMNPVANIMDVNDGFTYPMTSDAIKVMLTNDGGTMFTLSIENISSGSAVETPLAPGVFAVHNEGTYPIFTPNEVTTNGLEALAEDGDPSTLMASIGDNTGYWSPFAPGVYAIHSSSSMPLFSTGMADAGLGLESLAEDGDPSTLIASIMDNMDVSASDVFNTTTGSTSAGPLLPGNTYSFSFTASEGDNLSLATMLVQSNDLFAAFDESGIALFSNGTAVTGDVTASLSLWDAGTEVNEYPGAGNNQPLRQVGANTGTDEDGNVMIVNDDFTYPAVAELIKVTITAK